MADTVTVACPECGKKLKVREESLGKKVRCKDCDEVFVARAPGGKAAAKPAAKPAAKSAAKPAPKDEPKPAKPAPAAGADDDDENSNPYGVTDTELGQRCPECANEMEEGDVVCLHCGYNTRTRTRVRTRKVRDVTGGDQFLWLLPGILCVVTILSLITWDIIYCWRVGDWVDGSDYFFWLDSLAVKMWMVIITLFVMWFLGKFAFKRLVKEPTPPEIEVK